MSSMHESAGRLLSLSSGQTDRRDWESSSAAHLKVSQSRAPQRAGRASDQGGDTGNRTPDLLLAKQALYQLSYVPEGYSVVLIPA